HFITIGLVISTNANSEVVSQLIELQAFSTLYSFQKELQNSYIKIYPFPDELKPKISDEAYYADLKELIVGDENPANVIILEIYPEKQKTLIDFLLTGKKLGIKTVCLTK